MGTNFNNNTAFNSYALHPIAYILFCINILQCVYSKIVALFESEKKKSHVTQKPCKTWPLLFKSNGQTNTKYYFVKAVWNVKTKQTTTKIKLKTIWVTKLCGVDQMRWMQRCLHSCKPIKTFKSEYRPSIYSIVTHVHD